MEIESIAVSVGLGLFSPIVLWRLILLCRLYLYTGTFGDYDNTFMFQIMGSMEFNVVEGSKSIWKGILTEPHPLSILLDTTFVMLLSLFVGILLKVPVLFFAGIAIVLFIVLLRVMRKRIAIRQEFEDRLKGKYNDA